MKQIVHMLSVLFFILLLAACASPAVDPNEPPEIMYGEDVCDLCGMIISDERFAAGLVVEEEPSHYEHRIFDDIGDMVVYAADTGERLAIVSYFVHDYESREWIDAEQATFVRSKEIRSPMGFGLAAFQERAVAEAQAQAWQGELLDFQQLLESTATAVAGHRHADGYSK